MCVCVCVCVCVFVFVCVCVCVFMYVFSYLFVWIDGSSHISFLISHFSRSTNGNLYFQLFEELLVALEKLEEQDHKKRGKW